MKGNGHNAKNVGYTETFHGGRQEDETSERRLGSSKVDGHINIGQQDSAGIESGAKAGRLMIKNGAFDGLKGHEDRVNVIGSGVADDYCKSAEFWLGTWA